MALPFIHEIRVLHILKVDLFSVSSLLIVLKLFKGAAKCHSVKTLCADRQTLIEKEESSHGWHQLLQSCSSPNFNPVWLIGPSDSIDTGINSYELGRDEYLVR